MKVYWIALYKKIDNRKDLKDYSHQSNSCHKKFWW